MPLYKHFAQHGPGLGVLESLGVSNIPSTLVFMCEKTLPVSKIQYLKSVHCRKMVDTFLSRSIFHLFLEISQESACRDLF